MGVQHVQGKLRTYSDICTTMGTLADILSVLRRERARLFAKYGLKSMAVFGSATRDDFRPDSDVDIMVDFEQKPDGFASDTVAPPSEKPALA